MNTKIISNSYLTNILYLLFILLPSTSSAATFILYDETQNNLPNDQDWLIYAANGGIANATPVSAGTHLITDDGVSAGFSNNLFGLTNPNFPILDSTSGFTLRFDMQLNNESHNSNMRAGFSIILLDNNHQGVELAFWEDSIWSQSAEPLFQAKDESTLFNTTSNMLTYELAFLNKQYILSQNNNILLQGDLKDYSAFTGDPLGIGIPYSLTNYLFLGDDTSSASAEVTLGRIEISDTPILPAYSPAPLFLLLLGF